MDMDTLEELTLDDVEMLDLTTIDDNIVLMMDTSEEYTCENVEMLLSMILGTPTNVAVDTVEQDTAYCDKILAPQEPTEPVIQVKSTDQQEGMIDNVQTLLPKRHFEHSSVAINMTSKNTVVSDKTLLSVGRDKHINVVKNTGGKNTNIIDQMLITKKRAGDTTVMENSVMKYTHLIDKTMFSASPINYDRVKIIAGKDTNFIERIPVPTKFAECTNLSKNTKEKNTHFINQMPAQIKLAEFTNVPKNAAGKNTHLIDRRPTPIVITKLTDVSKNTAERDKHSIDPIPVPIKFTKCCPNVAKCTTVENIDQIPIPIKCMTCGFNVEKSKTEENAHFFDGMVGPIKSTELTNTAKDTSTKNTVLIDQIPVSINFTNCAVNAVKSAIGKNTDNIDRISIPIKFTKCMDVINDTTKKNIDFSDQMLVSICPTETTNVINNADGKNMDFIDEMLVSVCHTESTDVTNNTVEKNMDFVDKILVPICPTESTNVINNTSEMNMDFIDQILISIYSTESTDVTNNTVGKTMDFVDQMLVPISSAEETNVTEEVIREIAKDYNLTKLIEQNVNDGAQSTTFEDDTVVAKNTVKTNANINHFAFMTMKSAERTLITDHVAIGSKVNHNPFDTDTILEQFSIAVGDSNIIGLENCLEEIEEMSKAYKYLPNIQKKSISLGDDLSFDYTQCFNPQVNKIDHTNGITNVKNAVKIDQVGVVRKDEIIVIDSDDDDDDENNDDVEVNITEISDDEIHDSINTGSKSQTHVVKKNIQACCRAIPYNGKALTAAEKLIITNKEKQKPDTTEEKVLCNLKRDPQSLSFRSKILLANTYRKHNVPHLMNENLVSSSRPKPARRPLNSASN